MRKTPCPRCVAALASILPIALVLTGTPVDAGVLDRAKSVSGYPKGFLDEGMDLIGYGMSDDADTYERRADEFFRRQEHEGRKTFTDVVTDALADGKGKVSDGWKNLKGKVGNTLLGKAADAVKEKVWDAFAPDARPGGRHPPEETARMRFRLAILRHCEDMDRPPREKQTDLTLPLPRWKRTETHRRKVGRTP